MDSLIIDNRMRVAEKGYLRNIGYEIIELTKQENVYDEISSHVDIFFTKLNDKIVIEPTIYYLYREYIPNVIKGNLYVRGEYPFDILYNVCQIGKNVVHNFKYTDPNVLTVIKNEKLNMININQGYSKCSIAVVDDNSAIVTDHNIAIILKKSNIDILELKEDIDIKLLKSKNSHSKMNGFIGGATARVDNKFIVFGDTQKIDKEEKIKKFVESKGLKLVDFKGMDVIDYGGILII